MVKHHSGKCAQIVYREIPQRKTVPLLLIPTVGINDAVDLYRRPLLPF